MSSILRGVGVVMRCEVRRFSACAPLSVLIAAAPARAQLDNLLTGYSLTSWNEGDGHPLGSVYAMAQDRDGYLWIGADAGLFRFDGSRFTAWNTMSDAPLPRGRGPSLCVTSARHPAGRASPTARASARSRGRHAAARSHATGCDRATRSPSWSRIATARCGRSAGRELYRAARRARGRQVELPWPDREGTVAAAVSSSRTGDLLVGDPLGRLPPPRQRTRSSWLSHEYVWGIERGRRGQIWTTDIVAGFAALGAAGAPRHPLEGRRLSADARPPRQPLGRHVRRRPLARARHATGRRRR